MNIDDIEISLLSEEDVFGMWKIPVFKKMPIRALITNFAYIIGGHRATHIKSIEGDICYYALKDIYNGCCTIVDVDDNKGSSFAKSSSCGIRPIISYEGLDLDIPGGEIPMITLGEYPQSEITYQRFIDELDSLYNSGKLTTTGKTYTSFDILYNGARVLKEYVEYEYRDKKVIRIRNDYTSAMSKITPTPGHRWIQVSPIEWIVDEERKLLISNYILLSNIDLSLIKKRDDEDIFKSTFLYDFLNTTFKKDIELEKALGLDSKKLSLSKALDFYSSIKL